MFEVEDQEDLFYPTEGGDNPVNFQSEEEPEELGLFSNDGEEKEEDPIIAFLEERGYKDGKIQVVEEDGTEKVVDFNSLTSQEKYDLLNNISAPENELSEDELRFLNYIRANKLSVNDYLANYDYSKIAWVDGHQGSYVDESTGESNFVAVDGSEHFSTNIGITVGNSKILDEKLKAMKEVAFAASQNGEFDLAAEGIMNDNLQSLRNKIAEFTTKKREYEAKMEELRNQSAERIKQMEIEATKADNAVKLQIEEIKAQSAMEVAIIKQETELLVWDKRLQMDTDGNGYISNDEQNRTSLVDEANQRRTELEFKRQVLNLKREDLNLKRQNQSNKAK